MRVVYLAKDGALELNWMWLPMFIAQNQYLMRELQEEWSRRFMNIQATEENLQDIHLFTISWLRDKFPISGLEEYLSAIEHVREEVV